MVIVSANGKIQAAADAIHHHSFPFTFNGWPRKKKKCQVTFCLRLAASALHTVPDTVISANPHENNCRLRRTPKRGSHVRNNNDNNKILQNKFNFGIGIWRHLSAKLDAQ